MSIGRETACWKCKKAIRYHQSQLNSELKCSRCRALNRLTEQGAVRSGSEPEPGAGASGSSASRDGVKRPAYLDDVRRIARPVAEEPPPINSSRPANANAGWDVPGGSMPPSLPRRSAVSSGRAAWVIGSSLVAVLALGVGFVMIKAGGVGDKQAPPAVKESSKDSSSGVKPPEQPKPPPPQPPEPTPDEPVPPSEGTSDERRLDPSKTIAEQVEVHAGLEKTVFASSIIGMAEVDKKFFSFGSRKDCLLRFYQAFIERDGEAGPSDWLEKLRLLKLQALRSLEFDQIWDTRPLFTVRFPAGTVPEGLAVGVYVDVPDMFRKLITARPGDPVSQSNAVPVGRQSAPELQEWVDYNDENDSYELALDLRWNHQELLNLEQEVTVPLTLRVVYADKSEDKLNCSLRVRPIADLERYPLSIEYGAAINPDHPWVRRLINEINQDRFVKDQGMTLNGGMIKGMPIEDQALDVYLVWRSLKSRGVRYQILANGETQSQRIRPIHESMSTANAMCADGSVLFASIFEALAMKPMLVFVPNHVFVCLNLNPTEGDPIDFPIETTAIGDDLRSCPTISNEVLQAMVRRYPVLLKQPEFWNFVQAVERGVEELNEHHTNAQEALKVLDESKDAEAKKVARSRAALELDLLYVSQLRILGIRPTGSPPDLDRRYTYPKVKATSR